MAKFIELINNIKISSNINWNEDFEYKWLDKLSDDDKKIALESSKIGLGEFTSPTILPLMVNLVKDEVDKNHANDWAEILIYGNISIYEEFRHGIALSALSKNESIKEMEICEVGEKWYWPGMMENTYSAYGLLMSITMSEIITRNVYLNISKKIENKEFKNVLNKIQKDESRHYAVWREMTKRLITTSEYHYTSALKVVSECIDDGGGWLKDTIFLGSSDAMNYTSMDMLNRVAENKHTVLNYWFGDDNPYTKNELIRIISKDMVTLLKNKQNDKK